MNVFTIKKKTTSSAITQRIEQLDNVYGYRVNEKEILSVLKRNVCMYILCKRGNQIY